MDNSTSSQTAQNDLQVLRTSSLTGALVRELEHLILTGELKPGERLNEIQLSARFGTSRGPLREATRTLEAKGLVDAIRNRGVFVRSISSEEALEIYDIRAALFGLAGRLLTDMITDAMLVRLNEFLNQMDEIAQQRDFDRYYPLNLQFHDFLIKSTNNKTLAREYKSLVNKLHLCRARGLVQAGGLAVSNHEHREMVDALASGNRERAQEAFFRHVERSKQRFTTTLAK
ncbi:MAG: FCD domain-containing protein [Hoeflea sp.]|uniref:FCD domain-containing protein n=1 Tax=Hoeflea sp. TaxID=1940281 RepID=UPI001D41C7AF|nr:FCD domain-containing protein [Hoeflea sp.]MBU4530346.1 FCD domain-containing protein [Alphaproteobacteria bacterium]MBU4545133.1 FCD domain-containing protein [Alphaproteobacteria bacterium]MBU4549667.1 FCD domain-containing protein [Alphaproteobacteria bacterium]MBV1721936.1 FCD domain-containing protein [Hoeflea sp.]MBV1761286.1 FCD domain-containing protein [Hoeflea sp.]